MRRSVPGRALAALALLAVLTLPSIASAQPRPSVQRRTSAERAVKAGPLARLWSTWTHLWGKEGSILDPNGRSPQAGTPGGGVAAPAADEGSGLDPNGK